MFNKPDNLGVAHWLDPNYAAKEFKYEDGQPMIWLGRNPVNYDEAMGFESDNHVFLCGGTRSKKGRSYIINNLVKWPGSVLAVDPKGENATMCAERRGRGNQYCDGMGQDVYVLDPFSCAQVPNELRAYFNPLDAIDPHDPDLMNTCREMAHSLCVFQDGAGEGNEWIKAGSTYIGLCIAHVKTSPLIEERDRNLITVRRYCSAGNAGLVRGILEANDREMEAADRAGREPELVKLPDALSEFLWEMVRNDAFDGLIAQGALGYMELRKKGDRHFASILQSAISETDFLDSRDMKAVLTGSGTISRTFNINDLKNSPKPISVFLCLPEGKFETCCRWERVMVDLALNQMQKRQGLPRTGKKLLLCLDEFLSLEKMDTVLKGMNSIAGAGVQMMLCVTNINGMERVYGRTWQEFLAGCTLQIWFKLDDLTGKEFLEKSLGETEVRKVGKSTSHNVSRQDTLGVGFGQSTTNTSSTSHSDTANFSKATTHAQGDNWNESKGTAKTKTGGTSYSFQNSLSYGEANGTSAGEGYGPHLFFRPWTHTSNKGSNHTRNSGHQSSEGRTYNTGDSLTRNRQSGHGGHSSDSITHTMGGGTTDTSTQSHADTRSFNLNLSTAHGQSDGTGEQETFQKRSLLTIPEIDEYLRVADKDRDHLAYPGLALVKVSGYAPMLVRKSYYDDDALFYRCFTPNPEYPYIPYQKKGLMGCQYTDDHFMMLKLPEHFLGRKFEPVPLIAASERFKAGTTILSYRLDGVEQKELTSAMGGKLIEIMPRETQRETGELMLLRFDKPLKGQARLEAEELLLYPLIRRKLAEDQALDIATRAKTKRLAEEKAVKDKAEHYEKERQEHEAYQAWQAYAHECYAWHEQGWRAIYDPLAVGLSWALGVVIAIFVLALMMGFDFDYHRRLPYLCNFFGWIAFFFGTWLGAKERGDEKERLNNKQYTLHQEYGPCPPPLKCNGV